jgi:hypothetical protein
MKASRWAGGFGAMTVRFLMFIKHAGTADQGAIPKPLTDAMETFVGEGFKTGWLKETGGLKRPAESVYIRSKGGKLSMTDGPFAEAKEIIGGYAIVETTSKDAARDIARQFMELHRVHWPEFECESEVREIEELS